MTDSDTIRSRLRDILTAERKRLKLHACELATLAGIPNQTFNGYLRGRAEPTLSRVMAIEKALGRPFGWLAEQVLAVEKSPES